MDVHTEVDSSDPATVKLTVTASIQLLPKSGHLTAVVALFDHDGSFVGANQGGLDPRALLLKTTFHVKAGSYRVRLVIHDEQAQILEAQNQGVSVR